MKFVVPTRRSARTVEWSATIEELLGDPRRYAHDKPHNFDPIDPEPCDCCELGIAKFVSYDGFRRCQNCIRALVLEMGWDKLPEKEPEPHVPVAEVKSEPIGADEAFKHERQSRSRASTPDPQDQGPDAETAGDGRLFGP